MCAISIEKQVINLLQEYWPIDYTDPDKDTVLLELDSFSFIELVVRIETEFDIELYDEELLYNSDITIQKWVNIVEKHLNNQKENSSVQNPLLL